MSDGDFGPNIFGDPGDIDEFRYGFRYGDPVRKFFGGLFNRKAREESQASYEAFWENQNAVLSKAGYTWDNDSKVWRNPKAPTGLQIVNYYDDIQPILRSYAHQHPEFDVAAFLNREAEEGVAGTSLLGGATE